MSNGSILHVGVLILGVCQLLDAAAVDLLGMLTPEYLRGGHVSDELVSKGQEIKFHYIVEKLAEGEDSAYLSSSFGCKITVSCSCTD